MQQINTDYSEQQRLWIDFRKENFLGDTFPATISTAGNWIVQQGECYQQDHKTLFRLSDGEFRILQYTRGGHCRVKYRSADNETKTYDVGPEKCFFITNKQQFEFFNPDNCFYDYIYISFRGELAEYVFDRILKKSPVHLLPHDSEVVKLFNTFFQKALHTNLDFCALRKIATDLLLELETQICDHEKRQENDFRREAEVWATENIHIASVQSLAKHFQMSEKYFQVIFRKKCGMTPGKFLRELRLSHVMRLLACTEIKLNEIAEITGFADASHLCRSFRKHAGITPNTFRLKESVILLDQNRNQ